MRFMTHVDYLKSTNEDLLRYGFGRSLRGRKVLNILFLRNAGSEIKLWRAALAHEPSCLPLAEYV